MQTTPNPPDPHAFATPPMQGMAAPPAPLYPQQPMMYMMPYTYASPAPPQPDRPINQIPLMALILGIFAWPFLITAYSTNGFPFIALFLSLAPIILGHISLMLEPRQGMGRGTPMAIVALLLGYGLLSISLAWFILRFYA